MPIESPPVSADHQVLRRTIAAGVVLILALIGFGMLRYPRILSEGGAASIVAPIGLLLLYGAAALWGTRWFSQAHNVALLNGTVFGLAIGVVFVVMIAIENFIAMPTEFNPIVTLGLMLLIFLLFAGAGARGATHTGQVRFGILASVWSAMIGVLIALVFGFAVNFLFTQRLEQNLQASAEYARSGMHDLTTFTFYNTLDSAASHLIQAPIIAAVFGAVGSLIGTGLAKLRRKS